MHSYRVSPVPGCWEVFFDTGMAEDGVTVIKTYKDELSAAQLTHYLNGGEGLELVATVHRLLQKGS